MKINELKRLEVLTRVRDKHLHRSKAAKELETSPRRLLRRFKAEGPKGIVLKKLGAPGNRRVPLEKKGQVLAFFEDQDHHDFGPTLAHEYLTEGGLTGISISSIHKIMDSKWIMVSE
jgi:hypothetical protein